ncbi:MAG: F0F1 ATP synthase subunit A, partial [Xanthomonadaceae bacterium]|nr:F0F1 ATP synthase subunit A [Xanthomonadaceae bacterium]
MDITPDSVVYWQSGALKINATLVFTWAVMALLVGGSWLV